MSRILKVISNEEITIEEYKNPRVCFNNIEYDDIENYCVLRETINPFQMLYKNRELQQRISKAISFIEEYYYSANTMNIDCIGYTTDKMLKVRNILKGDSNE